jgi:hypothetical protein
MKSSLFSEQRMAHCKKTGNFRLAVEAVVVTTILWNRKVL